MLGISGAYQLEFEDGRKLETRAVLMSPRAGIRAIIADRVDFALFDFAVASAEYAATDRLLQEKFLVPVELERYAALLPALKAGQEGTLSCQDVQTLMRKAVEILTGEQLKPLQLDSRVEQAQQMIENMPLADVKLATLASAVNLSPDRFRHLFKDATGSTVSQYARTSAVWRALSLLNEETSITDASLAAGFHDVSHFYHVYTDMFGISLSEKRNIRKYRRVRCFD